MQRHGIKLLICIINDGGHGAETHKFRALASIRCTRPTAAATSLGWRAALG
jgi:hypothetical protein